MSGGLGDLAAAGCPRRYIVEYIESFNTKDTLYIVMEFVENGSLSQVWAKNEGCEEGEAMTWIMLECLLQMCS